MSSKISANCGKFSCNQVCLASSRSQLNVCSKCQPLERPRCSRTLTTESVPLHAVPTRHSEPARSRSPQRCFVVRLSQYNVTHSATEDKTGEAIGNKASEGTGCLARKF